MSAEVVNAATGEIADSITVADVDASIARVIRSAESIWDEWAWQVENEVWKIGNRFGSWDEMRRSVYGGLTNVTAPRAERPELVSRFRAAGLTQVETAATLGVSRRTVQEYSEPVYEKRSSALSSNPAAEEVIDAEIVDDEPTAEYRPRAEAITSQFTAAIADLNRAMSRLHRVSTDPNFHRNKKQVATMHGGDLSRTISELETLADSLKGI